MKKLGKKRHEIIQTIEAYATCHDGCDGAAYCNNCANDDVYIIDNNKTFNRMYKSIKSE